MRKWQIYGASLDPVVGSEQGRSRHVLVISEDAINALLNVVNVLPITTRKEGRRIYPNEVLLPANLAGLPNESIVLSYQIRTIDKLRLTHKYGELSDSAKQEEILRINLFSVRHRPIAQYPFSWKPLSKNPKHN